MRKNIKAHLGFALMWKEEKFLLSALELLKKEFADFKTQSEPFKPPFSKYYHKEMGSPLYKKFVITELIIDKSEIVKVKKMAMDIEDKYRIEGNRTVNIDPFYIDKEQLVVSTSKYRGNRVYMGDGVFVELELFYHHGSFQPFIWTYVDYKEHIPFFNSIRKLI
ncbi:DUF4416 family protein [Persephonella sp.]|uniref:DUF4416 family protein n=1 Tax=Persephonella sp. TaxID=2060922 RepID=UPI0026175BDA|nr:DUF4416 family protein [Persephonella sp.]